MEELTIHVMTEEKLKKEIKRIMLKNRQSSGTYQYTVPSLSSYPFQWLWDSCFHAIILVNIHLVEDAKKEMLSLVSHQFKNGMIPHMIYWNKAKEHDFSVVKWGRKDTSTITQPPMLAHVVWKIFKNDNDKEFLQNIYPNLNKLYRFILSDRDPRKINLIG